MEYVVGEVSIRNGDIVSAPLLNLNKQKIREPKTVEEFEKMIINVLYTTTYSSKIVGRDDFTYENNYDKNSNDGYTEDTICKYINGGANKYIIPRGLIIYHKKNQFMMECANMEFMFSYNTIPISLTTIPRELLLKRNSGFIQPGSIENNMSIYIKYNNKRELDEFALNTCFCMEEIFDKYKYPDANKRIFMSDYFKLNIENTQKMFNFQYIKVPQDMENTVYLDSIEYYNNKLDDYITKLNDIIDKNNYPILISIK